MTKNKIYMYYKLLTIFINTYIINRLYNSSFKFGKRKSEIKHTMQNKYIHHLYIIKSMLYKKTKYHSNKIKIKY